MNKRELEAFLDMTEVPFCDVAIWKDHNEIFRYNRGFTDAELTRKADGTELYNIYSASKVMAGAIGAKAVELGLISLDDPVCHYLPEYASMRYDTEGGEREVGEDMKLIHLFTMSAGLDYELAGWSYLFEFLSKQGAVATTRDFARAFATKKLLFKPGEGFKYSLCLDTLGAVLEVASGMSLGELFKKYIWGPLKMNETCFHPTAKLEGRVCSQYAYEGGKILLTDKRGRLRFNDKFEGMGGGIVTSVSDYIKFADALACGGVGKGGVRILDEQTVKLMRTPRLEEKPLSDFRTWGGKYDEYSYGLGVRVRVVPQGHIPVGEFGWNSVAGHYCMIDPVNRISVFYAQHVFAHSPRANALIHPVIRDSAYTIAGIK